MGRARTVTPGTWFAMYRMYRGMSPDTSCTGCTTFFPTSRRPTSQGGLGGGQRALGPGGSDALEGRHPGITNDDR